MLTMGMKKLIVGVTVVAAPAFAMAQSAEQLIEKYTLLAGNSSGNAAALVNGLRDGNPVTIKMSTPYFASTSTVCVVTRATTGNTGIVAAPPVMGFVPVPPPVQLPGYVELAPVTDKMGYGNVDNALTLAQRSLADLNIVAAVNASLPQRSATAEDVCIALMGGDVRTPQNTLISVPGILQLRAQGMGWGEIAKQLDSKL